MKAAAIVLAAGRGSRMNSGIQKQFMELGGYPLIYYALQVFEHSSVDEVILVTGKNETDWCRREIVDKYGFCKVRSVVPGGSERYLSVYEGLRAAQEPDIVLIHDGARPFVTDEIINRTIRSALESGSGIAAVPAKDTVRIVDETGTAVLTPPRDRVWMMQTPQAFRYPLIYRAYQELVSRNIQNVTDDAMVLETVLNQEVKIAEGSYSNIKVTTPEDMETARAFLKRD
ncbi:MAG: 2-C-methyl-D-erythritol 4-phosphate cytidylyltransferase [Eubacterium sp.]|jgi:2-C-methyl-D-erythritol 4-phosphate cytidylyltransferase|nr:2-C-methyl-D-erythritol 4-phosphate cytidylyltransferase [Eubacterium sp.]